MVLLNRKAEVSETSTVLEVFKFIENAAAEFSDEDEEEDNEGRDRTNVESRTVREQAVALKQNNHIHCSCMFNFIFFTQILRKKPSSSLSPASMDTSEDPDTEEALKGFDFLSSTDEMDTSPESRGNGDGTDWGECQITQEGIRVGIMLYTVFESCVIFSVQTCVIKVSEL